MTVRYERYNDVHGQRVASDDRLATVRGKSGEPPPVSAGLLAVYPVLVYTDQLQGVMGIYEDGYI